MQFYGLDCFSPLSYSTKQATNPHTRRRTWKRVRRPQLMLPQATFIGFDDNTKTYRRQLLWWQPEQTDQSSLGILYILVYWVHTPYFVGLLAAMDAGRYPTSSKPEGRWSDGRPGGNNSLIAAAGWRCLSNCLYTVLIRSSTGIVLWVMSIDWYGCGMLTVRQTVLSHSRIIQYNVVIKLSVYTFIIIIILSCSSSVSALHSDCILSRLSAEQGAHFYTNRQYLKNGRCSNLCNYLN